MKTLHIVITRLAVNWTNHRNFKQDWNVWVDESIEFMDSLCRESLKNQTTQNFKLLSLVDESVTSFGDVLPNEEILMIKSDGGDYPKTDILNQINKYIKSISSEYDAVIVTRLDRDDCLHKDFLANVQKYFENNTSNSFIDIRKSITYDLSKGNAHDSPKYHSMISPFVSTFEIIVDGKIECISMKYDHAHVNRHLNGNKVNNLMPMQVITGKNMLNRMYGTPITINKNEYGIK